MRSFQYICNNKICSHDSFNGDSRIKRGPPQALLASVSVDKPSDIGFREAEENEYNLLHSQKISDDICITAIDAWGIAGQPDKSEEIFQYIMQNYNNDTIPMEISRTEAQTTVPTMTSRENNNKTITISRRTYRALLLVQIRARIVTRPHEIIAMMENSQAPWQQPTKYDYDEILTFKLDNGPKYLHDADRLITRMEHRNEAKPDEVSYDHLLDLVLLSDSDDVVERIDRISGSIALLANRKRTYPPSRFNKAMNFCKDSTLPNVAELAERIVQRMDKHGLADTLIFNKYMDIAIKKEKRYSARQVAQRDESIGNNMFKKYQSGNRAVKPITQTWNTIIYAWTQCSEPDKAEQLLIRMETEFRNDTKTAPNSVSYSTVINGWIKSNPIDLTARIEDL